MFNHLGKIIYENRVYSREELSSIIESIISLIEQNVDENTTIVAIDMERSYILLCTILALLEMKICFVLLDKKIPLKRKQFIIKDSKINVLITDSCENNLILNKNINININLLNKTKKKKKSSKFKSNLAYIVYTSGSTGVPKGIKITINNFIYFCNVISKKLNLKYLQSTISITNINFDIFLLETIVCLLNSMTVVLANENEVNNPKKILYLLKKYNIEMLQITPSRLKQLISYEKNLNSMMSIKKLLIGGENWSKELLFLVKEKISSKCQIFNMYGPTEATIWASVTDLTDKDDVYITDALEGTKLIIDNLNNADFKGEIIISGLGVGEGYISNYNNQENAAFFSKNNQKYYRTGDVGYIKDGNIKYIGRISQEYKLNGYRIGLEEIDLTITKIINQPLNHIATCIINDKLVTFYTSNIDISNLIKKLKEYLPHYMIPTEYIQVNNPIFSLTGKLDKKMLIESYLKNNKLIIKKAGSSTYEIIKSEIRKITKIKSENFIDKKNFIDLGIDSLSFVMLITNLEEYFGVEFPDEIFSIYNDGCIKDLVEKIALLEKRD